MSKLLIYLSLIFSSIALGQAPPATEQTLKIEARFLYLSKHASTPADPIILTREGTEQIHISTRSPREYVKLPGDGRIIIGTEGPSEEEPIIPFASGIAPSGASKILVLLVPAKDSKYSLMILDERKFKGGSVCFINQSGETVGVKLDNKQIVVKNKAVQIHQPSRQSKARNTQVSFHTVKTDSSGRKVAKLLAETIWNISPTRGEICVFYRDQRRKRASFRVFGSSFVPTPKE